MMKISNKKVVRFHYTLNNSEGKNLESSNGGDPVAYLHGHSNIVRGLETAMLDRQESDNFSVTVAP